MNLRTWPPRVLATIVVVGAAVAIPATAAHADPRISAGFAYVNTLETGQVELYYYDRYHSASQLVARSVGNTITLDEGYPIYAGVGCTHPNTDTTYVTCTGTVDGVWVYGDDGDDILDILVDRTPVSYPISFIHGGAGNDVVLGTDLSDVIYGEDGNDTLFGYGEDDTIIGGSGADRISGGAGRDRASYVDHTVAVSLSLNGVTGDDGAPGEADTIQSDVEDLEGGSGNDVLNGNSDANVLMGGDGTDQVFGNAGDDTLFGNQLDSMSASNEPDLLVGGAGNDTVDYLEHGRTTGVSVDLDEVPADDGALGEKDTIQSVENIIGTVLSDTLTGNGSDNLLDGKWGNDTLIGGGGNDFLRGDIGDDHLLGGAGLDALYGNDGFDTCDVGPDGYLAVNCEA
jgi:Ca2+-binding RTX toxin-like protein